LQLYLIRHAESENNAKPAYQRVEDPALTAIGRLQAEHLAAWMKTLKFDVLITSPVLRALQTTRFIVDTTGHPVHVWADMFEEGGIYPGHGPTATAGGLGLGRADVIRHATGSPERCVLDDGIVETGWWAGRTRETQEQMVERSQTVIRRLMMTFGETDQSVVAVIHADFKRELLRQMTGWSMSCEVGALRNTGITKLVFQRTHWQLDWFNSVSHLPAKLITGVEH
jgi:2,3-bisphosphoglycerate-dependent phosphoglycerate mutase